MGSREKTLVIVGPADAGKATLTGCMLFKYGGIDMLTMQRFQKEGISTYEKAAKNLKTLNITPEFDTPKHHVKILNARAGPGSIDCAILVLPGNSPDVERVSTHIADGAKKLIVVVNKMDKIEWSEESFVKLVEQLKLDTENVPVIPISALNGDNIVDKSPRSSWHPGWKKNGQGGSTLLEALEISLQS